MSEKMSEKNIKSIYNLKLKLRREVHELWQAGHVATSDMFLLFDSLSNLDSVFDRVLLNTDEQEDCDK